MTTRYLIFGAVCAVAAAVLALVLWWPEEETFRQTLQCNDTTYVVSTGTKDGQCVTTIPERKVRCEDGSNYASAECGKGCRESRGAGVCKEAPINVDREKASEGKLSIQCGNVVYEISTGTEKGICAWSGPADDPALPRTRIRCRDDQSFASASCKKGCEGVRGSGSCEVIKLR